MTSGRPIFAPALLAGVLAAAGCPTAAPAQIVGPTVPPSVPASPQPAFPTLPRVSPSLGEPPAAAPTPARSPGPASSSPQDPVPSPAVARSQRVTVTAVERQAGGAILRARDEGGIEVDFEVAEYTAVLGHDASRLALADLAAADTVEVTWFLQGGRRTLLMVRRLR